MYDLIIKSILTILIVGLSYFYFERYKIRSKLKWAHIVPGLPILGNGLDLGSTTGIPIYLCSIEPIKEILI